MAEDKVCAIYLAYDDSLYTDVYNLDPIKSQKLKLLGNVDEYTKHSFNFVKTIDSLSDKIILCNPTDVVSSCSFAFEEVLKRVSDPEKVIVDTLCDIEVWKLRSKARFPDNIKVRLKMAHRNYNEEKGDQTYAMHLTWALLFYTSWLRLYNIDNKEAKWQQIRQKEEEFISKSEDNERRRFIKNNGLLGQARLFLRSSVVSDYAMEEYYENLKNFNTLTFKYSDMPGILNVLHLLAIRSNWRITPLTYNYDGGCCIMFDKDEALENILADTLKEFPVKEIKYGRLLKG